MCQSLSVGSLFSGIDAIGLGLEQAGMKVAFQCEIDPACRAILSRHWPGVAQFSDVREVHEPCDVLAGGFPCQDASIMQGRWGKRSGVGGERTGLFFEIARIAEETRPRYLVLENVEGLLSADQGRSFTAVLGTLADLGYVGEWRVLDGATFGLPLRRAHLVIVAVRSDYGRVPEGGWLAAAKGGNEARPQLLEGARQSRSADCGINGRPRTGTYRLLTPEECEEALGLPVGWTAGQSKTARYKQLGNSAAVPLFRFIGEQIIAHDREVGTPLLDA